MNNKVKDINKKEDKKQFKRMGLWLLGAGIAGGIIGILMMQLRNDNKISLIKKGAGVINDISIWCNWILAIVIVISTVVLYKSASKMYNTMNDDEDNIYSRVNYKLNLAVMIGYISQVIGMVAFFVGLADIILPFGGIQYENNGIWRELAFLAAGWIIATVCLVISLKIVFDFIKGMNPEKRGSVYDIRFEKKWLDSCDEAEKMIVYESGYTAYRLNQIIYPVFVLVSYIGMLYFDWDMSAIVIVGILWCISKLSYHIKGMQLERTHK